MIELLLGKPLLQEEFKLSLPRHVEGEEGEFGENVVIVNELFPPPYDMIGPAANS